jgi:hypothetical protein
MRCGIGKMMHEEYGPDHIELFRDGLHHAFVERYVGYTLALDIFTSLAHAGRRDPCRPLRLRVERASTRRPRSHIRRLEHA